MELKVFKSDGSQTEQVAVLHPDIFSITPNDHAIYLDVKQYLANQRQGTAKAKERSELSGSTRKLFRQKGTGGARRGDVNSPLLKGGARVFGPRPRDYGFKVNKKVKQLARLSALTYKANQENITVLDVLGLEKPKTKEIVKLLSNFNLQKRKVLLVIENTDKNIFLSARNLQNVRLLNAQSLNTYEILWANNMIMTVDSLKQIEDNFKVK